MIDRKSGLIIAALIFLVCQNVQARDEDFEEHKSSRFIIYYRNVPLDFVKSVESSAQNYYKEITSNLGFTRYENWSWEDRARIYIYENAEDYQATSNQFRWSHGAASARRKIIRTFPSAHGFFDSLLPHEMGHIIFREFVGMDAQIPLWFEEGVAMYQEKAKRWGANEAVKTAIEKGDFIPLNELTKMRLYNTTEQKIIDLFYAESASVVYYMIQELGQFKFVRFCRELQSGKEFEDALTGVYYRFKSLDDLNRNWVSYLKSNHQ